MPKVLCTTSVCALDCSLCCRYGPGQAKPCQTDPSKHTGDWLLDPETEAFAQVHPIQSSTPSSIAGIHEIRIRTLVLDGEREPRILF